MRPSIWTSFFRKMTPEDAVIELSKKGWRQLELSTEHGEVLMQRGNPEQAGHTFRQFAENLGVNMSQGHLILHCDIIGEDGQNTLDQLKQWLALFATIGIKAAVLHAGGQDRITAGAGQAELLDERVTALKVLTDHLQGTDTAICLENTPRTAPEAEDLLSIIHAVQSPNLGVCLDTGHLNLTSRQFTQFIEKTKDYLWALHIADNDGSGDQHIMPYGRGTVPWATVLSNLKAMNYQGLFNLEIGGETGCSLDVRRIKLDYLRDLLHWMIHSG